MKKVIVVVMAMVIGFFAGHMYAKYEVQTEEMEKDRIVSKVENIMGMLYDEVDVQIDGEVSSNNYVVAVTATNPNGCGQILDCTDTVEFWAASNGSYETKLYTGIEGDFVMDMIRDIAW